MSLVEFPYTLHKGYAMPIIPITILAHKIWGFVDLGPFILSCASMRHTASASTGQGVGNK